MNRKPYLRKTFVFKSWSYATTACLVVFAGLFSGSIHAKTQTMEQWAEEYGCLLYTSPSPRDLSTSRMPSSA